jgi:hypothetical protein
LVNERLSRQRRPGNGRPGHARRQLDRANLECLGTRRAAAATADHIEKFWAPLLRATLFEQARSHPERFSPIAGEAIVLLQGDALPKN